jgi:hypothetical protein
MNNFADVRSRLIEILTRKGLHFQKFRILFIVKTFTTKIRIARRKISVFTQNWDAGLQ